MKTGKEADVFLVERAMPGDVERRTLMAAKRYRSAEHRQFHRDAGYTEGRRARRSRDNRAMQKRHRVGTRGRLRPVGVRTSSARSRTSGRRAVPVPYPVMIDGTEILMEFIEVDGDAAPRLAQVRPSRAVVEGYFEQITRRDERAGPATAGRTATCRRTTSWPRAIGVVIIDLPQVLDIVANPNGVDFLLRDCRNVCQWFVSRGLDVDADALLAELLAQAW